MKQKHEKITDAVLLRTVAVSVAGILLCLAGLAGTTWAWFTAEIRSGPNTIRLADYSVTITDGALQNLNQPLSPGSYEVKLTMRAEAGSASCRLAVNGKNYYTVPLGDGESVTLTMTVEEGATASLQAEPCWGVQEEAMLENGLHVTADDVTVMASDNSAASVNETTEATTEATEADHEGAS